MRDVRRETRDEGDERRGEEEKRRIRRKRT
jgi:hypothetical protein